MTDIELDALAENTQNLPGADLVLKGLRELDLPVVGECGLLLLIASPRLRDMGIDVPERQDIPKPREHRLYELLEKTHGIGAYSRYNSLLRRMVSFSQTYSRRV